MRIQRLVGALAALAAALFLFGLALWSTAVTAQAETAVADLERISEETGFIAAHTALSPDCVFDEGYRVYLCEPPRRMVTLTPDPAARAQALHLLNSAGILFIPDSTNKRVMAFDAVSGELVDPNFIILDDAATGTAVHAILGPSDNILVSDQTRDVVHEYDLAGNYLGVFAPAGGANTAILDNIRGIALRPNGNLLVTVAASGNANAIAEFDTAGNYLGNFIASGSGGLNSPYDVYERPGTDWLVSSINNNLVKRYDWTTGSYIADLTGIDNFPQQIVEIPNGNLLVGNFSGAQVGVVELTSAGALVGVRTAPGVSGFRGVYELPNGNILTATSGGVFEIDRSGNLLHTRFTGQARYIEYVFLPSLDFRKTVGLNPSDCAEDEAISVGPGTAVTYCFAITNSTGLMLTLHDLTDSHLGIILDGINLSLTPGASLFVTQTAVITQTTVNTATWTAYNPGPTDLFTATDSATVTVVPPTISLTKTVGLNPSVCAETDSVTIEAGTAVTYCFEARNTGLTTLTRHDLTDSALGIILDGFNFALQPGASLFVTQTAVITQTTVNTATWTAYNPGPMDVATATDSATVIVVNPAIALTVTVGAEPEVCAMTQVITVTMGTAVTYCYTISNTGDVPFSQHTISDTVSGLIDSFPFDLQPGATVSLFYTQTVLSDTLANIIWLAESDLYTATASDAVAVFVAEEEITFYLYLPVIIKP